MDSRVCQEMKQREALGVSVLGFRTCSGLGSKGEPIFLSQAS